MIGAPSLEVTALPHSFRDGPRRFELIEVLGRRISGVYFDESTHNRFEIMVRFVDDSVEWFSVFSSQPFLAGQDCAFLVELEKDPRSVRFHFKSHSADDFTYAGAEETTGSGEHARRRNLILFDVSDLVYYIGHHDNLTGIQRVQACILLGLIHACPLQQRRYITFNNRLGDFLVIDSEFFEKLIVDLSRQKQNRQVIFDSEEAKIGILPNCAPLHEHISDFEDYQLVVYLLGAAWVNRDYFHRILDLKRKREAIFCMTVHDLIPIFARETCDQGTAIVFEEFLRKSFLFTDHYFTVSEYTALDLNRFALSIGRKNMPISVVENGHTLDEFFAVKARKGRSPINAPYVLFVSTIEGRKNHTYIFDVWSELAKSHPDLPVLVCVGRFGWRAESFIEKMLVTRNLDNKIRVMSDVSDSELEALYAHCLFTVYPSVYEGWGLPIGESLSKGKLCVTSDRSSIPEVSGPFGMFIDIGSVQDGVNKIGGLIEDRAYREGLERHLRENFVPRTWKQVAEELVAYLDLLPHPSRVAFPLLTLGREYKLVQLPPRSFSALGYAMIAEVEGARRASLTGYISRDEDLMAAQATRFGPNWYSPEDWGAWSRYPDCEKLFYIKPAAPISEIVIYEKLRVVGPLVGQSLRASVNDAPSQEFRIEDDQFLIRLVGPVRVAADGAAEVRIRYQIRSSADLALSLEKLDGRRLGLGFESTLVVDESDIAARVAMLERILFGGVAGRVLFEEPGGSPLPVVASASDDAPMRGKSPLHKVQNPQRIVDRGGRRPLDAPVLEIGEKVSLGVDKSTRKGVASAALLGRGWFAQEQSGVWSSANEAVVHFKIEGAAAPPYVLSLELRTLSTDEAGITISVVVNNVRLGAEFLRESATTMFRYVVDGKACYNDRTFLVRLHCDRLAVPANLGYGADTRELGAELISIGLEPFQPISLGRTYRLAEDAEFHAALASGWYPFEQNGVWSTESGGRIVGALDLPEAQDQARVRMTLVGRVVGTQSTGTAIVECGVQDETVATISFDDDAVGMRKVVIPVLKLGGGSLLDVKLVRRGAVSPWDIHEGEDRRRLGFLLTEVCFDLVDLVDHSERELGEAPMILEGNGEDLEEVAG